MVGAAFLIVFLADFSERPPGYKDGVLGGPLADAVVGPLRLNPGTRLHEDTRSQLRTLAAAQDAHQEGPLRPPAHHRPVVPPLEEHPLLPRLAGVEAPVVVGGFGSRASAGKPHPALHHCRSMNLYAKLLLWLLLRCDPL